MKTNLLLLNLTCLILLALFSQPSNATTPAEYLDCHFLAEAMFDLERKDEFLNQAILGLREMYPDAQDAQEMTMAEIYYRKGYFNGATNALSFQLGIVKGEAADILNSKEYCSIYKW